MTASRKTKLLGLLLGFFALVSSPAAMACSVCFGKSDSPLAKGMNMGIFTLLAVVIAMWIAVVGFFVYLAKRSASVTASSESSRLAESTTASDK